MLDLFPSLDLTRGVDPCTIGGMDTYSIFRNHQSKPTEVIRTGLPLAAAQEHCRRDDTKGGHAEAGTAWFDGYELEPKVFEGYAQVAETEDGDTVLELPAGSNVAICATPKGSTSFAFGFGLLFATCGPVPDEVEVAPSALVQGF